MTWVNVAIGGSAVLGFLGSQGQADAATQAARMQSNAAAQAATLQEKQYADLAPYRQSGQLGLSKIQEMLPYFTKEVTAQDLRSMPGFEFGLNQGTGAAGQAMNVGGGGSNGALHGLTGYHMDEAPVNTFFLEYVARPQTAEIFYEEVLMACIFYSMPILIENNGDY